MNKIQIIKNIGVFIFILASAATVTMCVNDSQSIYYIATSPKLSNSKPDFKAIENTKQRKAEFINYMLVAINNANKEIDNQKSQVNSLKIQFDKTGKLSNANQKILEKYLSFYKISQGDMRHKIDTLSNRIGTVPTSIVLSQAILESGWGTSRFAQKYNNYFGLHCFYANCGVQASQADVNVEVFHNATESVLGYYRMLNTGSKFTKFRNYRHQVNEGKMKKSELTQALENYSELEGDDYQNRVSDIIRHNDLNKYNQ